MSLDAHHSYGNFGATRAGKSNRQDLVLINTPTWLDRAKCAGKSAEADEATSKGLVRRFTRRYCDVCPVRRECYDLGVATNANSTIYGGVWFTTAGIPAHNAQGDQVA